ncbi:lipoprotein [Candidatus Megaera polyxenophila]|jgi:ABC-type branched-subunit amino acid transport system substrate-binding protein|uniref:penicillin-binding protein activator n=1 Tax=Candidatus Megaera polyxenophila TaxID=988779 RepID=UPI00249F382E|nr:penicillin-binding protein activator [Candidatus Megaera polyxenophila]BBB56931.1 lipoprotein [Candidatus Megaera polyxenophila]
MNNIKQKFTKFIISFCFLLVLTACESSNNNTNSKKSLSNNTITEVALLLPLSGENELLAKQYAGMIKMGLGDGAKTKIKVTSYDCSDEIKLKESIKRILEQKIKIIIGPIYSKDTKVLSAAIKDKDVIALSLSNDPTLADNNMFIFGHAPMRQIEQITTYLINNEYKNYVILLPTGRHTQIVSKIIQNIIANKEATLSRMEFYNNTDEDIEKAVNIVSDTVSNLNEQDEILKRPVVIVGDDPENLKRIYQFAKNFNLDKKAVIAGDNRIDVIDDKQFEIIYTGSITLENGNLKQRAATLGINYFSFMHALAYDAGKIVASNIIGNYRQEDFLTRLKSSKKFSGVSGKLYFIDSIAQREYEIIKKQNGVYTLQDNYPKAEIEEKVLSIPNN